MTRWTRFYVFAIALIVTHAQLPPLLWAKWSDHLPIAINLSSFPGQVDPHANSGGRRIVRIDDTIVVICPSHRGEQTFRSANNGRDWQQIDLNKGFSGTLVSGSDKKIYHFMVHGSKIKMIKFRYDQPPPVPKVVYENPNLSSWNTGVYRAINAIVDADGKIYIATHWGKQDQLYLLSSDDNGRTWKGPFQISSGQGPWYYPHLEVTPENELICVYDDFGKKKHRLTFATSTNGGISWSRSSISKENTFNPSLLPMGRGRVFVFAESCEKSYRGLVVNYTENLGKRWAGWKLIEKTCCYADPSPALGSDGKTIYVAFRSSNGTGIKSGTCGNRSRARMVMSPDLGGSWIIVDKHYEAERTGTRFQIRYQTWWNYGGPLEWIWMQYVNNGAERPIYYDTNRDVTIYKRLGGR